MSLAPLAVVALTIAGVVFGRDQAREALLHSVTSFAGKDIAQMLCNSSTPQTRRRLVGCRAGVAGVDVGREQAVSTAAGVAERDLGVPTREAGSARDTIVRYVIKRLVSFAMVMGTGALLLGVLVVQAVLSDVSGLAERSIVPEDWVSGVFGLTQQTVVPLALLSVACAVVYRVLPDVRIHWHDVWVAAC